MHIGFKIFGTIWALLLMYYACEYLGIIVKRSATARHILNPDAEFLQKLKEELSSSKNVLEAFALAAAEHSNCPSGKAGGSLGTFKKGSMVPAFDNVVFNEEIGKIHGPITTQFGHHLIFIESRSGDEQSVKSEL